MTPRNLFVLISKVLGIFLAKDLVVGGAELITTMLTHSAQNGLYSAFVVMIFSLLAMALLAVIVYYLIFKPHALIDRLQLDKDFDQKEFNLHLSLESAVMFAVVFTAAWLMIAEFPYLVRSMYIYVAEKRSFYQDAPVDFSDGIFSGTKILLSLLLIGERKRIVQFVCKRTD